MSTILLADDDQLLRLIMRERLERAGHEVLECGDGFAALEIAMDERPECLVLDVMMPLARGLEVVRQVRREEGWNPGIVMVSARTKATDRLNALDAGADIYLEKPIEPNALVEAVARVTVDRTPTRIVDVLGPVWATLAMDRLLRVPTDGGLAKRTAAITERFAAEMRAALGRQVPDLPHGPMALRVCWEQALRQLIGDATDPEIPAITDVRVPDLAALLRGAEPTFLSPTTAAESQMWSQALTRILAPDTTHDVAWTLHPRFAEALESVLGIGTSTDDQWSTTLGTILGHGGTRVAAQAQTLLESMIGSTLGDVLGVHSIESNRWARTLASVLAHRTPVDRAVEDRMSATLGAVMGRGPALSQRRPTTQPESGLWHATMDEVLRGPAGPIGVPDVREILAAEHGQTVGLR